MDYKGFFTKKRILFILLFSVLAVIAARINFSALVGTENQFFTLFQFFGPITGAFLGPVAGAIAVLLSDVANFFLLGKAVNIINLFRLTPMFFAAYYFGTKRENKLSVLVPIAAGFAFVMHPIGAQVWFYSMLWLIPIIIKFLPERLFLKSLGATFTAHSVGAACFLYAVPSTPEMWIGLIPVTLYERFMFALGITISYVAVNTFLAKFENIVPHDMVHIDPRYVLARFVA